jgi:Enolase C-terminal domain-like
MKSPLARLELDRRGFVKRLGALGAAAWSLSRARAFALPEDKIKVVHYFTTPGDAQGRQGQPMDTRWGTVRLQVTSINSLSNELIDYARVTLPNVGGITEFMKIVALAETHYIGMIPHFTEPISEAALVQCLTAAPLTALMEMLGDGTRTWPYLPRVYDFKEGKLWPNDRPGLGVQVDRTKLTQIGRYDTYRAGMLLNQRPDGSFTNW